MAQPTQLTPAVVLADRYRLETMLGRGGMGDVWRAFDTKLRRSVAVKRLAEATGEASRTRRARMLREARAVAALDHPNVVAVYDVDDTSEPPYIVMELVEGGSLATRMRRDPPTVERALAWLAEIADALACAHRAGLIHRDVKPENVLVGADGRVRVADFGAVKAVAKQDETEPAPMTAVGRVVGTPKYMSPEQLRGEPIDGRTDQYAWGLLAYELLAGVHPYDVTNPPTKEQQVADGRFQPPPLAPRVAGLPAEIEAVVLRALAASPESRAPDMGAVKDALARAPAFAAARVVDAAPTVIDHPPLEPTHTMKPTAAVPAYPMQPQRAVAPVVLAPPPPPRARAPRKSGLSIELAIGVALGVLAFVVIVFVVLYSLLREAPRPQHRNAPTRSGVEKLPH